MRAAALALLAAALAGLAACAEGGPSFRAEPHRASAFWLDPQGSPAARGVVRPGAPYSGVGGRAQGVGFVDPWHYQEYALFEADSGAQAEFIAAIASERLPVAIDYGATLEAMIPQWKAFADGVAWGAEGRSQTVTGWNAYRLFTAGDGRQCLALSRNWDILPADPLTRYGKALFGYHCAEGGAALGLAEAARFVARLDVVLPSDEARRAERFHPALPAGVRTQGVVAFARGEGRSAGNPRFPYVITAVYRDPDGGPFRWP